LAVMATGQRIAATGQGNKIRSSNNSKGHSNPNSQDHHAPKDNSARNNQGHRVPKVNSHALRVSNNAHKVSVRRNSSKRRAQLMVQLIRKEVLRQTRTLTGATTAGIGQTVVMVVVTQTIQRITTLSQAQTNDETGFKKLYCFNDRRVGHGDKRL
jgi:hypothetical protein